MKDFSSKSQYQYFITKTKEFPLFQTNTEASI
jgi:hypothetical protein